MTRWRIVLCLIVLWLIFALVKLAQAGTLNLAWDGVQGATGYRLYYGEASGQYPTVLDTGPATTASVGGLVDGTCYYFVATALDADEESDVSNEVSAEPRRNNRPRACRR
jgi:hypothetical protein